MGSLTDSESLELPLSLSLLLCKIGVDSLPSIDTHSIDTQISNFLSVPFSQNMARRTGSHLQACTPLVIWGGRLTINGSFLECSLGYLSKLQAVCGDGPGFCFPCPPAPYGSFYGAWWAVGPRGTIAQPDSLRPSSGSCPVLDSCFPSTYWVHSVAHSVQSLPLIWTHKQPSVEVYSQPVFHPGSQRKLLKGASPI